MVKIVQTGRYNYIDFATFSGQLSVFRAKVSPSLVKLISKFCRQEAG